MQSFQSAFQNRWGWTGLQDADMEKKKHNALMVAELQEKKAHLRHSTAPGYDTCLEEDSLRELFITGKRTVKG